MTSDPYIDPATGVLRNHLGISTAERLDEVDAALTVVAIADLAVRLLPGSYDLEHLRVFHREIFSELYPWAGEIRRVNIAKTDLFCAHQHIETYSHEVSAALAKEISSAAWPDGRSTGRAWTFEPTSTPRWLRCEATTVRFVRCSKQ